MSGIKQLKADKATEVASIELAQFIPYRIAVLGHDFSRCLAETYRNENITIAEWRVLAVIGQEETMAARDVVARTPMDKMAVSRAAASLEQKGIVLREVNANDKRVTVLKLSAEGRLLFDRIAKLANRFEAELLGCLDAQEAASFNQVVGKLEAQIAKMKLGGRDEDAL